MKKLYTVQEIQQYTAEMKKQGKSIGLVPTMGALHEGHLTLMRAARQSCDIVIASVFVNPVQFGPNEDYAAYPRRFEEDCGKLAAAGVDAVFHPEPAEMYPEGYSTYIEVGTSLTDKLCGAQRPGHFRGVATVVLKLLHLSRADRAFFGQKDAQQVLVIRQVVRDLNLPVEIAMVPIVREASGLARSSRNAYLSAAEKEAALVLSCSLQKAAAAYAAGERSTACILAVVQAELAAEPLAAVDYVECYAFPGLQAMEVLTGPALLAIAVRIGKTRLIDNVILGVETK